MQKDLLKKVKSSIKNYVINLDRATDRWCYMEKQFRDLGLDATRVPAVDCRHLTKEDLKHYRRGRFKLLQDSEVACFLSHRLCWQMIVDGQDEIAFIYEDDAYLSPLLPDFLEKRPWPEHIQLLSFERNEPNLRCKAKPIWEDDRYKIYQNLVSNVGSAGYMVTKDFAKVLLKHSEVFYHQVDGYLFHPRRVIGYFYNAYQITPALCMQKREDVPIKATYQEQKTRFTQNADFEKNDLSYYWLRLKMAVNFFMIRRMHTPIKIEFIEQKQP